MRTRWFSAAVVAAMVAAGLAGCGSNGSGSPITLPVVPQTSVTTVPATTAPATTVPETTPSEPTEPLSLDVDRDCLIGRWQMSSEDFQRWILAAVPNAPLTVTDGGPVLALTDVKATYAVKATVRFTVPNGYVDTYFDQEMNGTWELSGFILDLIYDEQVGGVTKIEGVVNGYSVNPEGFTPAALPSITRNPVDCEGDLLYVTQLVPSGEIEVVFDRVA